MTVKECYDAINGDYAEAIGRFRSDSNIVKFIRLFMNDTSIDELKTAFYAQDYEKAFRATHTLKGVLRNMAFNDFAQDVIDITEMLRGGKDIESAIAFFPTIVNKAHTTNEVLVRFLSERDLLA